MKRRACVPANAVLDPRLTPVLIRLLLALGLHTDKAGRCFVKISTLAAILATDPRNVKRYLRRLEELGYLRTTSQWRRDGGQRENAYELMSGGWSGTTTPGVVADDHPHKELVPEPVEKRPALTGPGMENDMNYIDLRDTEGASDLAPEKSKKSPTRPKAPRRPEKWNPVSLAQYFMGKARSHQWGHPGASSVKELAGTFRRWRDDHGVTYREMAAAIDVFFDQLPANLEAPAGRVFIKQGFQWIEAAKEAIYHEDLPAKQAANHEMWAHIRADLDVWLADNPGANDSERRAMKAALWQHWKQDPKYAISYA